MKTIPIGKIFIPSNRHRREFNPGSHQELVESIQDHSLLNAIVLRALAAGEPKEFSYALSSGERRLRAVSDIWDLGGRFSHDGAEVAEGEVPFVLLGELGPLERELCEADENFRRDDLTFQERASVVARIADLRCQLAEQRGESAPSRATLAADLFEPIHKSAKGTSNQAQETLRKQLIVARHVDSVEVQSAKTLDEAFKALRRKETSRRNTALATAMGPTFGAHSHTALNEDSLLWLQKAEAEQFDVILTDPPYGMGADEFGDSGGMTAGEHGYEDSTEVHEKLLLVCYQQLFRVAKLQAHLYWFCDIDLFHLARDVFEEAGWWVHRTPLIWFKPSASRLPWAEKDGLGPWGPQRKYELILYAVKGKRPVMKIAGDVITAQPDANLGHAAQKPVSLFRELLSRSAKPGDSVLDPFCGTGPIFPAAHELKVKATGIELDATSYGIALGRLKELK